MLAYYITVTNKASCKIVLKRNFVTESTIIATIHCFDVGYCLFRNPLVTHIPYHVPSLLLQFPIGYYFPQFAYQPSSLPCTQLGYSTLSTMYYWISTSVAIPYLFDPITCFVSYILSPLYLCFRTQLFRYLGSSAF